MGILDGLWDRIAQEVGARIVTDLGERNETARHIVKARTYRLGYQPRQMRVRERQFDDNMTLNLIGLVESRIISTLLGEGLEFRMDGDDNKVAQAWLDMCWDANQKEMFLHRAAMYAGEAGTGYIQIMPDGMVGEDGQLYPRLILIDPALVKVDVLPHDWEIVTRYTIEYKYSGVDGKEHKRKRIIESDPETESWVIVDYDLGPNTGGQYVEVERQTWPYNWSPMLHWQNKPSTSGPYGEPDIDDSMIALQDRINFLASNISKIIRLHAHPQTIAKNAKFKTYVDPDTGKETNVVEVGPDRMLAVEGDNADVYNLEQLNNLDGPLGFVKLTRQAFFDIARVVDIDSFQDKIGSLTNFGLRVLYQDQLAMVGVKRELLSNALEELNRRLLEMGGFGRIKTEVVWPETLPVDDRAQADYYQVLKNLGVIDDQSIAEALGLNWDVIQERISEQRQSNEDIGAFILRNFNRGGEPPA